MPGKEGEAKEGMGVFDQAGHYALKSAPAFCRGFR